MQKNKNKKAGGNDTDEYDHLSYFEAKIDISKVEVYLDEEILNPSYYRMVLQKIHSLEEDDSVDIIINTSGGNLQSAISIINAIRFCQGRVTGILNNEAASAGSLIALACPNLLVAPNSTLMIHSYSYGNYGKSNELLSNIHYFDDQIKKLMAELYAGFLSDKELEAVFEGKDYYFDTEEIIKRLENRQKFLERKDKEDIKKAKLSAKVL
jgi:ATP-dependent protease ClpP protease subunit